MASIPTLLITAAVTFAVVGYFYMLRNMRRAAKNRLTEQKATANPDAMSDTELDRYARHIVLREVGGAGQQRLRKARVLVVGAGGLGSPILLYLTAAGVGTIGVIDDDVVSLSNLQRQVLFDENYLDKPKVFAAVEKLQQLNPFVKVLPYNRRLTPDIAVDLIAEFDLVIDGTDTFASRTAVNAACVAAGKPLVWGAMAQWEGQVSVFDTVAGTPCFTCIFPNQPADGQAPTCADAGIIGALPGVIGSMMATEAIKHITGAGRTLAGQMVLFDALEGQTRKIKLSRNPDCPVCGGHSAE